MGSTKETLEIPQRVRDAVDERDGGFCRVCGQWLGERRALHHVMYGGDVRGMGGRRHHDPDEIVTVGWLPGEDCHSTVHAQKGLWQPLLLQAIKTPGVTALQLWRWSQRPLTG